MSCSNTARTSLDLQRLPTRVARHRRLCSSITLRNLSRRPSAVASNWKSIAQTWCGCSAWGRRTEPSARRALFCLRGGEPLQAHLAPETVHPLVVHCPAFPPPQALGHAPAPEYELSCDLAETMPQRGLLKIDELADMALAVAVLAHHTADPPLGYPVTHLQNCDGAPATLLSQRFPSARSLSIALSSSATARSLLSRAFSFSS